MAKVKTKPDKTEKAAKPDKNTYSAGVYNQVLDGIEKDVGISSEQIHDKRLTTGILSVDLIIGGGMRSGMMTVVGKETGGKTTLLTEIFRQTIKARIPIIQFQDAEGSIAPEYTSGILRVKNLQEVFGKRRDGLWEISPKARYYDDNIIESTYDRIARTLNRIPDKVYRPELDQWFLVVDQSDKKLTNFNAKNLGDPNTKLSDKAKLWFPTDNPYPQAFFAIDSYPALLPEGIDDNEETSKAMAIQARAFSLNLPRVTGKLRRKHVLIVGTNQIREKPGVMFGPTEYEPAGNSLRFNSQVRIWMTPRATPPEWRHDAKESKYSEEPSVEGNGTDQYAYKHVANKKNKWGTPFLETWVRVWISDYKGRGRGIDPVFDRLQFLSDVGLAKRVQRKSVQFVKHDWPLSGISLPWDEFKLLILAEEFASKDLQEKVAKIYKRLKLNKPFLLGKFCQKLQTDGKANLARSDNVTALKAGKKAMLDDDLEND